MKDSGFRFTAGKLEQLIKARPVQLSGTVSPLIDT